MLPSWLQGSDPHCTLNVFWGQPGALATVSKDVTIYTCMDRYGTVFLWSIANGPNDWNTSARRAVVRAHTVWVRLYSNQTLGRYQFEESSNIAEPTWTCKPFEAMINDVFEEHVIEDAGHEILHELFGEG